MQDTAKLLHKFSRPVIKKLVRTGFLHEDVEDAASHAIQKIMNVEITDIYTLKNLLYTATLNLLRSQKEMQKRKDSIHTSVCKFYIDSQSLPITPLEILEAKNRPSIMQLAKERLPPKQFKAVEMRLNSPSYGSRFATPKGVNEFTFRANWRQAMLKLRKIITDENLEFDF